MGLRLSSKAYIIFYQDETWVFKNMSQNLVSQDAFVDSADYKVHLAQERDQLHVIFGLKRQVIWQDAFWCGEDQKKRRMLTTAERCTLTLFSNGVDNQCFQPWQHQGKVCARAWSSDISHNTHEWNEISDHNMEKRKTGLCYRKMRTPSLEWPGNWRMKKQSLNCSNTRER